MESIIIWGTGKAAAEVLSDCTIFNLYNIIAIIDNDSSKWNTCFRGITVCSPNILKNNKGKKVVILSEFYKEIRSQIENEYKEYEIVVENKNYFYRERLLRRYAGVTDPEIVEVIENIKNNGLDVFNYPFAYNFEKEIDVQIDEEANLYFVMHKGKKLYFPKIFKSKESVKKYYNSISIEQDVNSPHRYLSENFNVKEGDVVAQGQSIGTVGNSAVFETADGSHLHFEILKDGEYVNPDIYVK